MKNNLSTQSNGNNNGSQHILIFSILGAVHSCVIRIPFKSICAHCCCCHICCYYVRCISVTVVHRHTLRELVTIVFSWFDVCVCSACVRWSVMVSPLFISATKHTKMNQNCIVCVMMMSWAYLTTLLRNVSSFWFCLFGTNKYVNKFPTSNLWHFFSSLTLLFVCFFVRTQTNKS